LICGVNTEDGFRSQANSVTSNKSMVKRATKLPDPVMKFLKLKKEHEEILYNNGKRANSN